MICFTSTQCHKPQTNPQNNVMADAAERSSNVSATALSESI